MAIEFYRQMIPLTKEGVKFAGHMVTNEDESQSESYEWESGVAYPANTAVLLSVRYLIFSSSRSAVLFSVKSAVLVSSRSTLR